MKLLQLLLAAGLHLAAAVATPHGVLVTLSSGFKVELAVQGLSAFRVSAANAKGVAPAQLPSPMLAEQAAYAKFTPSASGIKTSFGALSLTAAGVLTLADAAGKILSSGALLEGSPPAGTTALAFGKSAGAKFYGSGAGKNSGFALEKTSSSPHVANTDLSVSRFWSTDGFAALGVTSFASDPKHNGQYPASWDTKDNAKSVIFTIMGDTADVYLMPAATAFDSIAVHWALTGKAAMPPRYAFGFMACRWGWQSAAYIDTMLKNFRSGGKVSGGGFPIDAWISDFEW